MGTRDGSTTKRSAAREVVRRLQDAGHVAYFAGGCVRDRILGIEPSDFDVATDARPERVVELFRRSRRVGQAFGVVRVGVRRHWVEVATFRAEWGHTDHRRPDRVEFTDARHDARRRDFTINGLFYDPLADRVIDHVGGRADIEAGVIRAIGDPGERFEEDYLRMLRAVRFSARLGFRIEPGTWEAIGRLAPRLTGISRERIGQELRMMFEHASRATAAELLQTLGLDAPMLDEAGSGRTPVCLAAMPVDAAFAESLAAWAVDRRLEGEAAGLARVKGVAIARRWRAALVLSNEETAALRGVLQGLAGVAGWRDLGVAGRKRLLARRDWPAVRAVLGGVAGVDLAALDAEAARLIEEGVAPTPLVTGDDLVASGMAPGPSFKRVIESVYDAQLEGRVTTRDEALRLARSLGD